MVEANHTALSTVWINRQSYIIISSGNSCTVELPISSLSGLSH